MELEVILGNPVKIARAKGYEMPRLQSMYALLKVGSCPAASRQARTRTLT